MELTPEVNSAIIKVAGDWAVALALTDKNPEPSSMSGELQEYFVRSYSSICEILDIKN